VLVETFVPEATIQALDEPVLHRLARRNVVPLDLAILLPLQDCPRCQLGAVVADDHERPAAKGDERIELAGDPLAGERGVDDECQAFAGEVVDHDQHTKAPSVDQLVGDEVQAPALVRALWHGHRRPCPERALAPATPAHRQPLFTIEPEQLLMVQHDAAPPQQDVQPPIAEPSPLTRQGLQALPDRHVVGATRGIAIGLRIKPDQAAGSTLRVALLFDGPGHERSPRSGLQK